MSELYQQVADDLSLTPEDRSQLLPSGKQFTYRNRLAWARTYLKKAGLIEAPTPGTIQITARGNDVLAEKPAILNVKYLRKFPEFLTFISSPSSPSDGAVTVGEAEIPEASETPDDTLERVSKELHDALAEDLLGKIKAAPPAFFEKLVVDLLVAIGYGGSGKDAGQVLGKSGDGGVDGLIKEDRLGLDTIYVQAQRWEDVVGEGRVRDFAGGLDGVHARKGVLITTSSFSPAARNFVGKIEKKIVLIDGAQLVDLMIEHNVGVRVDTKYEIKKVDAEYFEAWEG